MVNKILVVPGNTDLNRGDQALVWETIRACEDIFGNLEVYLYESGSTQQEKILQKKQTEKLGYTFLSRILLHPRVKNSSSKKTITYNKLTYLKWGITAVIDLFSTLCILSRFTIINKLGEMTLSESQKKTLKIYSKLEALVVKGGGFLHSYGKFYDIYVMYYFLFDLLLAQKNGVKTIIFPNSIGPLKNTWAKNLVKKVLKKSTFISVREDVSRQFVKKELDLNVKKYPDLGFFLETAEFDSKSYLTAQGINLNNKNIAITLRPYRFDGYKNPDQLYNSYISELVGFIKSQILNGYEITLFAHTLGPSAHEDDRIALLEVYNKIAENDKSSVHYLEDFDLDCKQIQNIYSCFDILIGTRFHSVIFSLNAGTPSIAIAYGGNKSYGIMKDIGLPEYVIGIESVKAKELDELMNKLNSNRESYLQKLSNYQDVLQDNRLVLINDIKSVVQ